MNWRNVRLIYRRELRDQLRDRRTLFMIIVLPMLLYPMLGMSVFQLSQFVQRHEVRVLVVGGEQLEAISDVPPLVEDDRFAEQLFSDSQDSKNIVVERLPVAEKSFVPEGDAVAEEATRAPLALDVARRRLNAGDAQVVLYFPSDFANQFQQLREQLKASRSGDRDSVGGEAVAIPEPEIFYHSAREASRIAQVRVEQVLEHWKQEVVRQNMSANRVPLNIARPFRIKPVDVSQSEQRQTALWAKVLPLVMFLWALTGAFYPAVDVCAGEKERGTLETLLCSPATRGEIVWGKLLTVMSFSCISAVFNLASLGLTIGYVVAQLRPLSTGAMPAGEIPIPPLGVLIWLVAALLPMSALFSALSLALAAFARSTKEGQYYLMPLLLLTMPLVLLPMSPGIELNLGNSLIPITGGILILRSLIQGEYMHALPFVLPVVLVTIVCCWLAIRWAIEQFNRESVLFRESERFELIPWMKHLFRDRQPTPSFGAALTCVLLIFLAQFLMRSVLARAVVDDGFGPLAILQVINQIVCIGVPMLVMTLLFTTRPLKTLLLENWPRGSTCLAAVLLAFCLHPPGQRLVIWIQTYLFPMNKDVLADLKNFSDQLTGSTNFWLPFMVMALLPAILEELAFRGFILSGLRHVGHKWWAIGLSAVFFGMAHTVIQQSLMASVLGLVLGYLAIQTGHLLPCILFHATYNGLMLATGWMTSLSNDLREAMPLVRHALVETESGQAVYSGSVVAIGMLGAAAIFAWLHRQPYRRTDEERIEQIRALQSQSLVGDA